MRKKLYGFKDILDEFLYLCHVKNIPLYLTRDTIHEIITEDYSLYEITKRVWTNQKRVRILMCEWNEDWRREYDDWVLDPDRFVSGITNEYYRSFTKKTPL